MALHAFNDLLGPIIDKYAPVKKQTVRNVGAPWLDQELKELMDQRNKAKAEAIRSADVSLWNIYRKLRNNVTKLNKNKKKMYYQNRIIDARMDSKKIWNILNGLMGKRCRPTPSFLEADENILTNPVEIANYLSSFFNDRIQKLRDSMDTRKKKDCISSKLIKDKIMNDKMCNFQFENITADTVEKLLRVARETPAGIDNLDVKLFKTVADLIALPISFIINLSLKKVFVLQNGK